MNLIPTPPVDRQRIDLSHEAGLRYWTRRFGVTPNRLAAAIGAVGRRADSVEAYLSTRGRRRG